MESQSSNTSDINKMLNPFLKHFLNKHQGIMFKNEIDEVLAKMEKVQNQNTELQQDQAKLYEMVEKYQALQKENLKLKEE